MAVRPFWKGYLKLSLVTCPVAMTPATSEGEKVRFHTLNRATGNRIVSEYVDSVTGETVESDDEVKGYERGENDHVMLEDEELDAVALDTTHTIDIEMFAPRDSVGWIWYDKPHYLAPNDKVGEEAFTVIREAMAATNDGRHFPRRPLPPRARRSAGASRQRHRALDAALRRRGPRSEGLFRRPEAGQPGSRTNGARHVADRGAHQAMVRRHGGRSGSAAASRPDQVEEKEGRQEGRQAEERRSRPSRQRHQHHGRLAKKHRVVEGKGEDAPSAVCFGDRRRYRRGGLSEAVPGIRPTARRAGSACCRP